MQTQQRLRLLAGSFLLLAVCAGSSQALSPVLRPIAPGSEPWSASRGFQSCAMLMVKTSPAVSAHPAPSIVFRVARAGWPRGTNCRTNCHSRARARALSLSLASPVTRSDNNNRCR